MRKATATTAVVVVKRMHLIEMPFDAFDVDNNAFVHATGDRVQLSDGSWHVEYADSIWEDAPDVEEEWEDAPDIEEEHETNAQLVLNGLIKVKVQYEDELHTYRKVGDNNKWEGVSYASYLYGPCEAVKYVDDDIVYIVNNNSGKMSLLFE